MVIKDVPDCALIMGNPKRQKGWMSRHGNVLCKSVDGVALCTETGLRYMEETPSRLVCLYLKEDSPLPAELSMGEKYYDEFVPKQ